MIISYATFLESRKRRQRAITQVPTKPAEITPGDDPAVAVLQPQAARLAVEVQRRPAPIEKC